jgi:hypothetical protein
MTVDALIIQQSQMCPVAAIGLIKKTISPK